MSDTDSGHSQEVIVGVADRLFTAIEQSDVAMLNRIFDDDIAVWRVGARCDNDKERALKVLHWFIDVTAERHYEILDRQFFSSGFVQQHILHAAGHSGESIALRVCIVIKVGINGLISRIDEYFDPAEVAPLLSYPVTAVQMTRAGDDAVGVPPARAGGTAQPRKRPGGRPGGRNDEEERR